EQPSGDLVQPTVEQILDRTRLAMNDITSYRVRGATLDRDSTSSVFSVPLRNFSEFQSYDRYRWEIDSSAHEHGYLTEYLVIGTQNFTRSDREGPLEWRESERIYDRGEWQSPFDTILSTLDNRDQKSTTTNGMHLVSDNEVTDDGVRVYHLEIIANFKHSWGSDITSETRTTTLLIDRDTYKLVARTVHKHYQHASPESLNGESSTSPDWWQMLYTERYYDYDEPIIVEAPDDYIPWHGTAAVTAR
ncbi:MAG: hypothetical protein O7E57_15420, partial [Gammaproteobacteria bacterium]|nr:hypothetical protein [Gammaproteobacteria bacterium]